MNLVFSSIEQGLIYAVLAMGVYMTFKVLKIADMTVEGSFPLGALFCAMLLLKGVNPILATFLAFLIGIIPGIFSALIAIKLHMNALLAGILTMTMMYSINLHVNGKPNVPFTKSANIFDLLNTGNSFMDKIIILLILVIALKLIIDWFFSTKMGYMLISTGDNEALVRSLGEDPNKYRILGVGLANGMAALSGALFAQTSQFADTQMGIGILVISLASIIIGDTLFRSGKLKGTTRAIMGAIVYKIIGGLAVEIGLNPVDLKLINGLIVIIFIFYNNSYTGLRKRLLGRKEKEYVKAD